MPLSSISSILIAANSGMRAAQVGLDVVSRNVANASTEGYTRKTIHLQNQIVGAQGQGVIAGEIQRTVNLSLQREIRRGNSLGEAMRVREDFLGRLELAFGSPGDESSISAHLTNLGNAFRALAAQPDSSTQQQSVIAQARAFATASQTLSATIQSLRLDAEQAIKSTVTTIEMTLAQTDRINQQIVQARGLGQSTADLEDKRDTLLDAIAKDIDVTFFERQNGDVWILTNSGRQLLDGTASEISFNNKSAINATMTYAGGALAGVELGGHDISAEIRGGRLRGYLDLRDDYLVQAQQQLDELTARVAQTFALSDLDLFSYGDVETVITGRTAGATATAGSTTFDISDPTGVAIGMQLRFAGHPTTYTITDITGSTITVAPPTGASTGLDVEVGAGDALILAAAPSSLSVGFSAAIAVNAAVTSDPWRLRDGTSTATPLTVVQDNTIPRTIVDAFERLQPFSETPGLGESLTLTGYAGALITAQANRRASAKDALESQTALNEQIANRFNSDSGVNVDRELALMIEIQNAYAASAKVIQATRDMFEELLRVAA